MNPRSIDLRSIACKGIRSFNLFQKPSTFALLSLHDGKKLKTAVDPDGGDSPEWDDSFRFDLDGRGDRDRAALEIEIAVQGNIPLILGERVVARAIVPLADLLAGGRDGSVRHVTYRLAGTDGRPNGVVSFSYHLNYPPPPVTLPPPRDYCHLVPDPIASAYYPPPPQQYPLPPQQYPLPRQEVRSVAYPPPAAVGSYWPPSDQVHGAYPPPSAPPAECWYPSPQQACCYPPPAPRDEGRYRPETWDRGLY